MAKLFHSGKTLIQHLGLMATFLLMFLSISASAQNNVQRIDGKVIDLMGEPLAGASVLSEKVANLGTVTDSNGSFSLEIASGDKLVVSFLGYQTRTIDPKSESTSKIILKEDLTMLDQVVVVSYGTSSKRELIGSVASVNVKDLNSVPTMRAEQAIQGKVAGVMVTQNHGEPGAGVTINVRGVGTIGDSDPLYVIDGIPTKSGLAYLNPSDIESISVLKDASSAAMYGSRAANGVVLVKTKSGRSGRFHMDFDAYWGVQVNMKKFDMMNASEWASIRNEAFLNDNPGGEKPWENTNLGAGTDWQDEIMRNAFIHNYNFGVSGGSDKIQYALSINHYGQDGIIKFSNYKRNSLRANITAQPVKWFEVGSNTSLSMNDKEGVDIEVNGVLKNAILSVPTMKVYEEDGSFSGPNTLLEGNSRNPVSMAANANMHDKSYRVTNNTYAQINFLKNLHFKTSLGLDYSSGIVRDFDPTYKEGSTENAVASLRQADHTMLDWIWENTLNYDLQFNKNKFKFLAGFSMEENVHDFSNIRKTNYAGNQDFLQYLSNGSKVDANDVQGSRNEWSMISYFARVDYNYGNRYLLSANVRADGSSRFARGNRYSVFPSFAAGWRLSEENFAKDATWLDDFKIKASWGQLGNQDIGLYAFAGTLSSFYYNMDGKAVIGYAPGAPFNENISWETTSQADFGLEFSMFEGALSLEADYYIKTTKDMLVKLPTSATSGFGYGPYVNAGSIRNQGFELTLAHRKQFNDFKYEISGNLTTIKNEVLSLGGNESPIDDSIFFDYTVRTQKGHPMRQMYGYVMEGIYQNQDEINKHMFEEPSSFKPGDVRYKDLNNNGRLDPEDRTIIGNTIPKLLYGLNFSFNYKGLDFLAQFQGVAGNDIYNCTKFWSENTSETHNYSTRVLDSWRGEGTSNTMPRLTMGATKNHIASTRFVEKGDYFRLKNLQLGYTLPKNLTDKMHIRSLRFYFNAQNVFTLTKYSGFNPEVGMARSGNRSSYGLDEITYPMARTFTFGINLGIF